MKFQSTVAFAFPPPQAFSALNAAETGFAPLQIEPQLQRSSQTGESGTVIVIIPAGDTGTFSVTLHQLTVGWGDVEVAGKIEIRCMDPSFTIYQTAPSGTLVIPCYDETKWLGQYGLRAVNSSTGGEYSITALYTVKDE